MSDKLDAIKAKLDATIKKLKKDMGVFMEMLREEEEEEKRLKRKKKNTRVRDVKRTKKDKAAEDGGGQQSDDNEDSVSVKSEIESDECHCESNDEGYSNIEVKKESSDEEDSAVPVASTSSGRKRQATPARNVAPKKRRVDTECQKSTNGSGIYKKKVLSVDCAVEACQHTFRCVHKMREHLLAVHKVKPFPCRAQGCGEQFDTHKEFAHHSRTIHRIITTTWLCPDCPDRTFASAGSTSTHISDYHQTGQFQCAVDQCQFTSTTRRQVNSHQQRVHLQHTCPFNGCTRSFKKKSDLTRHQRLHRGSPRCPSP